jgi:biopolymer transport protein ExbD
MAQIDTGGGAAHSKHDKKRAKKLSTRIDMTPMVDLAFLLLTFFVLTSTFSKPKVLRMIFPEKIENEGEPPPVVKDGLTIIVDENNKIYTYSGSILELKELIPTDYSKDGLRKILKNRNKWLINEIAKVQKESDLGPKNDTAFDRKMNDKLEKAQNESRFIVLVKHTPKATYKNMIDVVDEFLITQVGKYFVVDEPLAKIESDLLEKIKKQ